MKRNSLLVLMLFLSSFLFAQIEKGDVLISLNGNYSKSASSGGFVKYTMSNENKTLNLGSMVGYMISERFMLGVGLNYNWEKDINAYRFAFLNESIQAERTEIESNVIMPTLYCGYYVKVAKNLYFNAKFELNYGKLKSDYYSVYASKEQVFEPSIDNLADYIIGNPDVEVYTGSEKVEYFKAKISPEIMYFLNTNMFLNISMGGFEYEILDWRGDYSNWHINFNPQNWKFGFGFKL